jgi:flagellar protein FliS
MIAHYARHAYTQANIQPSTDPKRLILLLYEGAIKHLTLTHQAILERHPRQRAEHLSRSVSIIAALHDCLDTQVTDDAVEFLRGLYRAMLVELSKVTVSQDISVVERALRYVQYLKDIWEQQVVGVTGQEPSPVQRVAPANPNAAQGYRAERPRLGHTVSV